MSIIHVPEWSAMRNSPPCVLRHASRPLIAVAISFALGIAAAQSCRTYCFSGLAAAVLLMLGAAFLALRRSRTGLALTLGLMATAGCGFLMALAHRDGYAAADVRSLLARNHLPLREPVGFDGCILEEPEQQGPDSVLTIALHGVRAKDCWLACKGKAIVRMGTSAPSDGGNAPPGITRGDRIRGWATWQIPRNYENPGSDNRAGRLARRGIFIVGRTKSLQLLETIPGDCATPWTQFANAVRQRVRSSLEPIQDRQNGQEAAILASLVVGDYTGLRPATREVFQNTGTFHVLVVSGLHVAWIAGLLLHILKYARVPERLRYLLAALAILAFTCIVGFQASITRCFWVFLLYLAGRMLFRRADTANILFGAALILLAAEPDWLFETGFQLSFLSVLAIAWTAAPAMQTYLQPLCEPMRHCGDSGRLFLQSSPWHRRGRRLRLCWELCVEALTDRHFPGAAPGLLWMGRAFAGTAMAAASMILVSLSIQMWIEPLLAHHFNRMSWIGPLANIVMVPLSSLALAAGILGALATLLGSFALVPIAGSSATLLLSAASFIAQLPGAWQRCPTPTWPWVVAGMGLLGIWGYFEWRKFWIPCLAIVMFLACLGLGFSPIPAGLVAKVTPGLRRADEAPWPQDSALLSLAFLDVGEGDCIIIRFPDAKVWVLDAGGLRLAPAHEERAYALDIGEAVVSRYLWHSWHTRLDRLLLSHTDLDHAGGMPAVIQNFGITQFGHSLAGADPAILDRLLALAEKKKVRRQLMQAGYAETIGSVKVRVLHPRSGAGQDSANASSLVLQFQFGRFSALLAGDLEGSGEALVLQRQDSLRSQLLKVAHHGSRTATSHAFLDRVQPRWAVISAGRNNPYRHPAREVLARLRQHKVRTLSTMDCGAITFETDGIRYQIKSHVLGITDRGELERPGMPAT